MFQGANGPRPTYAPANNGSAGSGGAGGGGVGVGVGPNAGGHGLKGGAGGGPRGGNPVQYRASSATGTSWGAAPSHAAVAAAGYAQYTRYPSAAAAGQMPVGAQQLPPTANPYAATAYAQHASVRQKVEFTISSRTFYHLICIAYQQLFFFFLLLSISYINFLGKFFLVWTESTDSIVTG